MQHFALGFVTGLLVWLSLFIIYRVKGEELPGGLGIRSLTGSRRVLNALYWGVIGGVANLAVDIDFLLHLWLGFPYRFLHTEALILGAILVVVSAVYLWRSTTHSSRISICFLGLLVGFSFMTHVLEDYLLGWF